MPMIFPSPPLKEPLFIQTVDIKKIPRKLIVDFIFNFCIAAAVFYFHDEKEFLGIGLFSAIALTVALFTSMLHLFFNPYRFALYEEGIDIKGLGLCPWYLVVDCESSNRRSSNNRGRYNLTPVWAITLSCVENESLLTVKKLAGAKRLIPFQENKTVKIVYESTPLLSRMNFDDFDSFIRLCIQSAKKNNGLLNVTFKTDHGFELSA